MIRKFVFGFILFFSVFSVFGGWHSASQIVPGSFPVGNFVFDGDVEISSGNDVCIVGGNCLSSVSGGLWSSSGSDINYNSGNVGIGIAVPEGKFHVSNGDVFFSGEGTSFSDLVLEYSGNDIDVGSGVVFTRSLGTSASPSSVTAANTFIGGMGGYAYEGVGNYGEVATIYFLTDGASGPGDTPGKIVLQTTPDGSDVSQTRMTIKNDGNVGIGIDNPLGKLHVNKGDVFLSGENSDFADLFLEYSGNNIDYGSVILFTRYLGTSASPSPVTAANTLVGGLSAYAYEGVGNYGEVANIYFVTDAASGSGDTPGKIIFQTTPDGSDMAQTRMTIKNNGMVGIGTSGPNDALDVVGDIDATGCIQTDNAGSIGGTCLSDVRLKENVISIDGALDKISQLRPVTYNWREDMYNISGESGSGVGLIAQEFEMVFPNLVRTEDSGYKKIRYDTELQMYMLAAIKELKEENNQLRSEIENLKNLIN